MFGWESSKHRSSGVSNRCELAVQGKSLRFVQLQRVEKRSNSLPHSRVLWRIEDGEAVLVAYHIYRGPKRKYGTIDGALGRSESGIEIILAVAYQVV